MKAILRTNNYNENYKIVDILKNPISETNQLAKVLIDGEIYYTGGILCKITEITLNVLNSLSNKEQWDWLLSIHSPNLYK